MYMLTFQLLLVTMLMMIFNPFMWYYEMLYLAYLRPSRELLEYYRKKIAEFDDEHESVLQRLDQYKMTYEEQVSKKSLLCIRSACVHFS